MSGERAAQIAAAKEQFAALPEHHREQLAAAFDSAQEAAKRHIEYRRPQ